VVSGKPRHLGTYATEADAALAYDVAARRTYGHLTALNFPWVESRTPPPRLQSKASLSKSSPQPSRYRGVSWHRKAGKWQATTKSNRRLVYLGLFDSEADAARAYDSAVRRLRGDRAKLNFS
jgi:uncharacterized protein YfiM (DUF2279 family)